MTLHEAIEKLLRQTKRSMSTREIAFELNQNKWYVKRDRSPITSVQIAARADDHHDLFEIDRSSSPLQISLLNNNLNQSSKVSPSIVIKTRENVTVTTPKLSNNKKSFPPISYPDTTILILGTLPGDKSLELQEYYGHKRNRFWKIISTITNSPAPLNYYEKKQLLIKAKIGLWDVAYAASRKGSLDTAIQFEQPNDLEDFIEKHKSLKAIAFNGKRSEELFNRYFVRKKEIKYFSLPSTSPANQSIDFVAICALWQQLL